MPGILSASADHSAPIYASTASIGKETVRRINEMYEWGTGRELIYMGPEQVRVAIRKYLSHDIDFVKYAVSGHSPSDSGFMLLFSPGVQRIIIDETHERGMTAQTHTTTVESLRMAVEAGADLMQHPDVTGRELIPDELAQTIANRKIPCAISIAPQRFLRHSLGENFGADPSSIVDERQRSTAVRMQNFRKFMEEGAMIR